MTTKSAINEQQRQALVERVACYTVGIASNENTGIGTGTLVAIDGYHLVITAEHVIKGDVQSIRFWCRPPAPSIEKAAKDLSPSEIGRLTEGRKFPIETIITDSEADLAAIKIPTDFQLPEPNEFYSLDKSWQLAKWPQEEHDGLSLLYFGFPAAYIRLFPVLPSRWSSPCSPTSSKHWDHLKGHLSWPTQNPESWSALAQLQKCLLA